MSYPSGYFFTKPLIYSLCFNETPELPGLKSNAHQMLSGNSLSENKALHICTTQPIL
jgi:hypothetical protein